MRVDYNSPEALAPVIEALVFASDEPLSAAELRALILGEEQPKTDVNDDAPAAVSAPTAAIEGPDEVSKNGEQLSGESAETVSEETVSEEAVAIEATMNAPKKIRKRKQLIELPTIHSAVELLNEEYLERERAFRIVAIAGGYQFATRPEYAEYVVRLFKEKSRRRLSGAALETLAIIAYKQPVSKLDVENVRGVNCDEVLKSLLEKNLITITGRAEAVGRPLLYGTTGDFLRHFGLPTITDLPKPREIEELMKEESIRATTLDEAAIEFVTQPSDDRLTVDELLVAAHAGEDVDDELNGSELEESETEELLIEESEPDGIELDVKAMELNTISQTEEHD
jgi:segregation and condensation protein B